MATYFGFLALLAFKIFAIEQVDVAILEVGLGGRFDATNVVQKPVVCGISSLGYDHMEILGNTLAEIAGEKAGIFISTSLVLKASINTPSYQDGQVRLKGKYTLHVEDGSKVFVSVYTL